MTLWLVHFDNDEDTGDAVNLFDLAAGDYGMGEYHIVAANTPEGALYAAVGQRKGTR